MENLNGMSPSQAMDRLLVSRRDSASGRLEDTREAVRRGSKTPRVAILGAGASGLAMAIRLLERGITSFTIYEKSDGVGGTWRDNTYPGAACDVPSHLYSLSFAPKRDWTRKFPRQPEILAYFESLVPRFGLQDHIRTGVEVTSLTWDEATKSWQGTLETRDSGTENFEADVVVSGLGQLNQPNIPNIDGLSSFEGEVFHSARWNHEHDLRGERVAVIGIGASAIQFVPQVAKQARSMVLFQRSVNYVIPKPDRRFRPWEHWVLANVPAVEKLYRESIYWRFESRFNMMRKGSVLGGLLRRGFTKRVRLLASDHLDESALVPDYNPGCRRILIANDWYPTLAMDSVSVVTDPVERIGPRSVTAGGVEHRVDTIIFGTGFRTTEFLTPLKVAGRGGVELNDVWSDGARAMFGLSVPSFPNFFMLYGPNTNLGHNSILFMVEQQVGYILQLIDMMVLDGVVSVDATAEAMERFDTEIQDATRRTVWDEDCSSWYKNETGRITNNWPDYTVNYRRRLAHVDTADWSMRL
ncbi:MAG: NAD(P)/FAD-dependent oxidoreductase [Microthrixaceae bacterium]|nr:NAD(P)/FAD-dependent oxidoreductase [Microthrixaceae bacterium]